jgi:hypothetical protein
VDPEETLYHHVNAGHAEAIVQSLGGAPVPELQCDLNEHFDKQVRVVLENAGHIDPEKIDDYICRDGYKALLTALTEMTPNGVIHRITESGLRGRGGGGYPTGLKWGTVAKAAGDLKYVVCNGDEGDPGAFMDRSVMEGDPHRVIEGMAIAAYAVGASKGFIYVRPSIRWPSPADHGAARGAAPRALLGNGICNTPFNFDVEIRLGAGAFVCGEETALLASIEGKRGTPKPRLPIRRSAACGASPRSSTTSRPSPTSRPSSATAASGLPTWARREARAPRSSRSPARSPTPAWWKCPWASSCARSSRSSAAACRTATPSRRCRPAVPPAAAFPPRCSTWASATMRSWRSAPSWAPAA